MFELLPVFSTTTGLDPGIRIKNLFFFLIMFSTHSTKDPTRHSTDTPQHSPRPRLLKLRVSAVADLGLPTKGHIFGAHCTREWCQSVGLYPDHWMAH